MKQTFLLRWLFIGMALLLCSELHAQASCPSGKYQASPPGTSGPSYCAPIPHDRQGRPLPPPAAASHWGAIATDAMNNKVIGAATDQPGKHQAEQMALAECRSKGGAACKTAIAYGNGCGVLVASSLGYTAAADVTISHATETGIQTCSRAGGNQCHVAFSACSPTQPMP